MMRSGARPGPAPTAHAGSTNPMKVMIDATLGACPTSAGASVGPSPILFDRAAFSRASSRDEDAREKAALGVGGK